MNPKTALQLKRVSSNNYFFYSLDKKKLFGEVSKTSFLNILTFVLYLKSGHPKSFPDIKLACFLFKEKN